MELVIKLDDETYKEVMNRTEFDTLSLGIKLIEAVQNGTPLEEELEKIRNEITMLLFFNRENVVEVIDNHIAELKGE